MRKRRFKTVVLGLGASLLLGSGVISAVSDSAASAGNKVQSTPYTDPVPDRVAKLALVDVSTECDDPSVVLEDGPIRAGAFEPTMNLNAWPEQSVQDDYYCVVNSGREGGDLYVGFENSVDTDVECTETEASVDWTCGAGEEGELSAIVSEVWIQPWGKQNGLCPESRLLATFQGMTSYGPILIGQLGPGGWCKVHFALKAMDATQGDRRVAQSDRLEWDIRFMVWN